MRTLSALFGLSLIVVAIGIGWWSPIEREVPADPVIAAREEPEQSPPQVEIAAAPPVPSVTDAAPIEAVAEEPEAEIPGDVFYTTANVRMRSGPASSFNIVWTAPVGTRVHSIQVDGNWHLVRTGEYEGWMYARYMREGESAATQ
jgi:uncharacterized protein YgiM (DUF1202 family)